MSLYNMLLGVNPIARELLGVLGDPTVERFRDIYVAIEEGEPIICVYARTGGGNREHYKQLALTGHKLYIRDQDDDFDVTFATYYFSVPRIAREILLKLAQANPTMPPGERMKALLDGMKNKDMDDPMVKRAFEQGEKLLAPVFEALEPKKKD